MIQVQVFLYSIAIAVAKLLLPVAGLFSSKIALFRSKRIDSYPLPPKPEGRVAWFHCASMGEFEQGRPVIAKFRQKNPDFKILVSFFSPSGYDNRRNDALIDVSVFLPLDGKRAINQLLDHYDPKIVFFVKYEFWYYTLKTIYDRGIPLILFASIFRKDQLFFKWYGGIFKAMLSFFDHIFVQNLSSKQLLERIKITNVSVSGDTRFERVQQIKQQAKDLPEILKFKSTSMMWVCGSTWPKDHDTLIPFIKNNPQIKFVVVPHEIVDKEIDRMLALFGGKAVCYSAGPAFKAQVLIVDQMGLLSHIYQYANYAYIGGAFGKGLHNTLEAAAYGIPIFFGNKNYQKFAEAVTLKEESIAIPIADVKSLELNFSRLTTEDLQRIKQKSDQFMKVNQGASQQIVTIASQIIDLNGR